MTELETLMSSYAKIYLRLMRVMDRRMSEHGASFARTKLLLLLDRNGARRSSDIAEVFSQSPRTVTEAVDALEREGLVRRDPDPADRRAKLVSVTPEGRAAVAKTEPLRRELVAQVFGGLGKGEQREFQDLLDKLTAALDALPDARSL